MYYFLAMLVPTDLSLPLPFMPTTISVHWLSWKLSNHWCLHHWNVLHPHLLGSGIRCSGWPCPMTALWLFAFLCTTLPLLTHGVIGRIEQQSCCGVDCAPAPLPHQKVTFLPSTPTPSPICTASIRMPWGCQCWTPVSTASTGLLAVIFVIVVDALLLLASSFSNLPGSIGHCFLGRDTKALNTSLSYLCHAALLCTSIGMTVIHCFGKNLSPVAHTQPLPVFA